jgi:septal ring factor EnvC (AmiA/AmiB activator)
MGVPRALIFGMFGAALALPAHAQRTEIFKCVDATGRASYTNDKRETEGKQCEVVTTQINVAPPPKPPSTASRRAFPRESASERLSATSRQRDVLEKELAAEEQDLAKARQALAEQEAVRYGDERNYARVLERLQPFKDRIETHEKNIEALRRELSSLR